VYVRDARERKIEATNAVFFFVSARCKRKEERERVTPLFPKQQYAAAAPNPIQSRTKKKNKKKKKNIHFSKAKDHGGRVQNT